MDGSRCAPASSSGGSPSGVVVSGSYDGLLRLWNGKTRRRCVHVTGCEGRSSPKQTGRGWGHGLWHWVGEGLNGGMREDQASVACC
mgnify:CR=1 FL=1